MTNVRLFCFQVLHPLRGEVLTMGTTAYLTWKRHPDYAETKTNLWLNGAGGQLVLLTEGVDHHCSVGAEDVKDTSAISMFSQNSHFALIGTDQ